MVRSCNENLVVLGGVPAIVNLSDVVDIAAGAFSLSVRSGQG